jgi:hypothetical protein
MYFEGKENINVRVCFLNLIFKFQKLIRYTQGEDNEYK